MSNERYCSTELPCRGLLLVALCLSVFAAAEEGKEDEVPRNERVWLQVRGNVRVSRETILGMIQTRDGERFDQAKLDGDWQRLTDSGLFASVTTAEPPGLPGAGHLLVIEVVEHPAVNEIRIETKGVRNLSKDASPDLGLKRGKILAQGKLEAARAALAAAYAKAGTAVRVEARTEPRSTRRQFVNSQWETSPDTVDVVFEVRAADAADGMVSIPGASVLKEAERGR